MRAFTRSARWRGVRKQVWDAEREIKSFASDSRFMNDTDCRNGEIIKKSEEERKGGRRICPEVRNPVLRGQ